MEAVLNAIKIERYPAYKDSGVEWLGEIPEHWEIFRVKNVFRLIVEPAQKQNNYELLSVYTDIGVKPRKELEERGNKASTTDGYWLVRKGDIVVNKLLAWMGAIGISDYNGVTSPAYDILRPIKRINGIYYHNLFRTASCISELKKNSRGIMDMRLRLYFDKFGDVLIPYPPLEEQNAIIKFLDRKTAQIDKAIAQKEKLIELLKERRQILIHNAVTRGLNPDVPMKDSRVEWIGKIPEQWEFVTLRRLTKEHKQGYYSEKAYVDEGYSLVRITDLNEKGEIDISSSPYVVPSILEINLFKVRKGDFLFPRTGSIGLLGVVTEDLKAVFASYLIRFRFTEEVEISYLKYFFLSDLFINGLKYDLHGGVNQNIHAENIKNQFIPLPPIDEQKNIVNYISVIDSKVESALKSKFIEIEKLKEYKATLINAAVTGKIKVSEAIKHEYSE